MNLLGFQQQKNLQHEIMDLNILSRQIVAPISESSRVSRAYDTEAERAVNDMNASRRRDTIELNRVTVTTPSELRRAIESHRDTIIVTGDLAEDLQSAMRIMTLSPDALSELESACATLEMRKLSAKFFTSPTDSGTPNVGFTGGPLGGVLVAASEATGLSLSVIRTIATIGFALILSLFDDYALEIGTDNGKLTLRFRLKRRK